MFSKMMMVNFMMYMCFQCLGGEGREVLVVLSVGQLDDVIQRLLVDCARLLVVDVVVHVLCLEVCSDVDVEGFLLVDEFVEEWNPSSRASLRVSDAEMYSASVDDVNTTGCLMRAKLTKLKRFPENGCL